ncbi:exported hypothetical protein [Mesorhizobium plurifarium]|uniref:Uncharacterized protein n=1 Tax=Mesorhizobium plurifarium TaxID=69974 RepID=A0A0K2VMS4_MESPL|nr:exported hypothetical protein [Mesorhizobium plurifarium]
MDNLLKGLIAVTCIAILAAVGWYFTVQWIAYNQAAEARSNIRAAVTANLDAAVLPECSSAYLQGHG